MKSEMPFEPKNHTPTMDNQLETRKQDNYANKHTHTHTHTKLMYLFAQK